MRRRRATPRRRDAPRWTREEWEPVTWGLWTRCRGRCERCDRPIIGSAERHHRQRREVGGDRYANLLLLHSECHAYAHAHPEEARAKGWIVSAYATDLLSVPVYSLGRWWLLDDEGARRLAPDPPEPV
jgi:hypothetical protein